MYNAQDLIKEDIVGRRKTNKVEKPVTVELPEYSLLGSPVVLNEANLEYGVWNFKMEGGPEHSCVGDFNRWFLGKTEEWTGGILSAHPLLRNAPDLLLIEDLGGFLRARIMLADIYFAKGKINQYRKYVGYVEDVFREGDSPEFSYINEKNRRCILRAVIFFWRDGQWHWVARPIGSWLITGFWILSHSS